MPSNHHTDEVYTPKRRPKKPIKFNVHLNDEQKQAKALILDNPITALTRPTVSKEDIGFLPGDIREKMDPWLAPIYHNLYMLYNKEKVDKELENGNIEIVPFAFMRGRTFVDSFVIVDEAQNVTHNQMETVIGRLGRGSKMVICGDMAQIDLKDKRETGFSFLSRLEENVEGFKTASLVQNHRHSIVSPILEIYRTFRD